MKPTAENEANLHMIVDDDFRTTYDFSVDKDYPNSEYDEMNTVRVSIVDENKTVAYMELYILYETKIDNIVMFADGIAGDVYRTMSALNANGLLEPFDPDDDINDDFFDFVLDTIVHLNYIAVRDEYRKKGIGDWLLRNLPRILSRNYGITPRLISTTICPQNITWGENEPSFTQPDETVPTDKAMYKLMEKLFVKNGYQQIGSSEHFYAKARA
jgi:ribosomal protein S18 acetylase RimI-like enzyme